MLRVPKLKLEGKKPIRNSTDLSRNCIDLLAKPSLSESDVLSIDESVLSDLVFLGGFGFVLCKVRDSLNWKEKLCTGLVFGCQESPRKT